jgi:predicted small metal-binding protein
MRVLECDCGTTLQADDDDQLADRVREHVASDHPEMQLDDEQVRGLVEQKAQTA